MADEGDFLVACLERFQAQKRLAEGAIAQVSDDGIRRALSAETNSIAVVMKHLAGNMRSRWTDFLTSDGEKDERQRDDEFVDDFDSRADIMDVWERGWECLFSALNDLGPADLARTVRIRGAALGVDEAILRQLDHYGYHIGQIVLIARVVVGDGAWETLTIGRGQSEAFNASTWER